MMEDTSGARSLSFPTGSPTTGLTGQSEPGFKVLAPQKLVVTSYLLDSRCKRS